jgi:hypothetical protein
MVVENARKISRKQASAVYDEAGYKSGGRGSLVGERR